MKQDLDEKIKGGHVDRLYTAPKEGSGKEIKHDWLWSRMGGWFQDTGKLLHTIPQPDTKCTDS